jgi:2-amino-4-hydroxy-6-hydroxymethyldihydropteridine diphosphokinase
MKKTGHQVCLLLGSNIRPEYNLPMAVGLLRKQLTVLRVSSVWESAPVGGNGPNFLNAALLAVSHLDAPALKQEVLLPIEAQLGRVRNSDKNSPRPIDLDIIFFDQQLMDPTLGHFAHRAVPVSEVLPKAPAGKDQPLKEVAARLVAIDPLHLREEVVL